jgi:hypothetical protein
MPVFVITTARITNPVEFVAYTTKGGRMNAG